MWIGLIPLACPLAAVLVNKVHTTRSAKGRMGRDLSFENIYGSSESGQFVSVNAGQLFTIE